MASLAAIGLMSGTSYDCIDVALIETDGEKSGRLGPTGYRPYSDRERDRLRHAMAAASHLTDRNERPKLLAEVEELVTDMHAEAVEAFLAANGMTPDEVGVVGFHGQTVLHRPDRAFSLQLGNGPALAARLGIAVVYDFRAADIAAGGQGRATGCPVRIPWQCSTWAASPTSPSSTATRSLRLIPARATRCLTILSGCARASPRTTRGVPRG